MAEVRDILRRLPDRMRAFVVLVLLQLALLLVLRAGFFLMFRSSAGDISGSELLAASWTGTKFDLRLALLVTLPFLALTTVRVLDPFRTPGARRGWLAFYVALDVALLLLHFVDFGHYEYLHERLNSGLIDQVLSPAIAMQMVWESYPVVWGLLALAAATWGWKRLLGRFALPNPGRPALPAGRSFRVTAWTVFLLAVACGIYGKVSWYPLRWSDAYSHTSPFARAMALNPALFFWDSFPNRGTPYDEDLLREHYDELAALLEVDRPDREALDFTRTALPVSRSTAPPNLVVIHVESLAGYQTGVIGDAMNPSSELDASPVFDRLSSEGILFGNVTVPRGPTARSVFTMLTGTPDMNPVRSSSRNPRIVSQHTLLNALDGYAKLYFLGGSAAWANIRGLLAHNVAGLEIYEEGDFEAERGDVWGISDLALFEKAFEVMQATPQPFFTFIQTSGNHEPYTIPDDMGAFVPAEDVDEDVLVANGFKSLAAYNGFRFLDYSLGHFFELVKRSEFHDNTLFVLYGDHGTAAPHGIAWEHLNLTHKHVPLLYYAPGLITEPRRIDTVGSTADLLPTALGLMGMPYVTQTLGRDLLAERPADARVAFIRNGLLTDDHLLRVDPDGTPHVYAYRGPDPLHDLAPEQPALTERLVRRYTGLDQLSAYLLYHNPPRPHPGRQ
jgi:phosphoglycerol transferase MdoB-like AlkP superfamily enzyme